jgi:hypothetical protein
MMTRVESAERLARIAKARASYDRARDELMHEIKEAFGEADELPGDRKRELGPSAIGRAAGFTREYIAQLRSGRKSS